MPRKAEMRALRKEMDAEQRKLGTPVFEVRMDALNGTMKTLMRKLWASRYLLT